VLREQPGVPRWQYGVIGVIWMLAYAVGSGYAWYMVSYKAHHNGWGLAETMNALDLSVFSMILGALLSAVAGGGVLYLLLDRARQPDILTTSANQGSRHD
jgi:prolipoprotein diacylglyceryltransferase